MSARPDASALFQEVLASYYHAWFRYHPEAAVDAGVAGYEHLLTPFLPDDRAALVCLNDQLIVSLDELDRSLLNADEALDYDIARNAAWLENQWIIDIEPRRVDPDSVLPIRAIHQLTIKPVPDRVAAITARLAAIPEYLKVAMPYLAERAEHVPKRWAELAVLSAREGVSFLRELQTDIAVAKSMAVFEPALIAVDGFAAFLNDQIVPRARGNFAVGRTYFEHLLQSRHFLDIDADDLYRFGERLCDQTRRELLTVCRELTGGDDQNAALKLALGAPPAKMELLEAYRSGMNAARAFVAARDLVSLPLTERLDVVETPVFLRHQIPFAAYSEPTRNDSAQQGYYYVTPPESGEQLAEHGAAGILHTCAHEAWPGHHLQFVTANSSDAAQSLPRLLNPSATLYEGWALYCEQLMHEQGFLEGPQQRFLLLRDRLWRTLRILIDIELHVRNMPLERAAEIMMRELGFTHESAMADLAWYTRSPTVPLGYATGWALIDALKNCALLAGMSLKQFHDRLLSVGSVALPLVIRRAFGQGAWVAVRQELSRSRYTQ